MTEYIKGADGKFYVESNDHEGAGFVEVQSEVLPTGEAVVRRDGKQFLLKEYKGGMIAEIEVKDTATYLEQRNLRSSDDFLQPKFNADPNSKEGKQKIKRMDVMQQQLNQMVQDQAEPVMAECRRITDEQFLDYNRAYQAAVAAGTQDDSEFQPLNTYRDRIKRARQIFKGEVGVRCEGGVRAIRAGKRVEILVLEQGFGSGNLISVPGEVK
jgi:hypothetical protein